MSESFLPIYNQSPEANVFVDAYGNKYIDDVPQPIPTIGGYMQQGKQAIQNGANNVALGWDKLNGLQKINTVGSALMGLYGAYNAHKQLGLAKDTLNFNKDQYYTNLNNQRKMVNSQLEDRQRRRVAQAKDGGTTTISVGDYMAKYGV